MGRLMQLQGLGLLAGAAVGGFVLYKAISAGRGLLTGENGLTRNATDASGNRVDAYQGVPVIGTLGAAANEVSGGYLASAGKWIGSTLYDLFNPAGSADSTPAQGGPAASYDETARLLRRYPGPVVAGPESVFSGQSLDGSFSGLAGLDGDTFEFQTQPWRPKR